MSKTEAGNRILVSFPFGAPEGQFSSHDLPYHVTLLPWYDLADNQHEQWQENLANIAAVTESFSVKAGEEAYFGKKHDILVRQLSVNAFKALHFRLLNALESDKMQVQGQLRDESIAGKNYRPHITQRYSQLLDEGQELTIGSIAEIVKLDAEEGQPDLEISGQYNLRNSQYETAA